MRISALVGIALASCALEASGFVTHGRMGAALRPAVSSNLPNLEFCGFRRGLSPLNSCHRMMPHGGMPPDFSVLEGSEGMRVVWCTHPCAKYAPALPGACGGATSASAFPDLSCAAQCRLTSWRACRRRLVHEGSRARRWGLGTPLNFSPRRPYPFKWRGKCTSSSKEEESPCSTQISPSLFLWLGQGPGCRPRDAPRKGRQSQGHQKSQGPL